MILGSVVGTVWATRKSQRLADLKMVIVRPYFWYRPSHAVDNLIAVDKVGAEEGQDVVVCMGAPGRWQAGDARTPIEASVMAIVDRTQIDASALTDPEIPFRLREDHPIATLELLSPGAASGNSQEEATP